MNLASRFRPVIVILAVAASCFTGFWLGRTTTATRHDTILPENSGGPPALVASLRDNQTEQVRRAGELLAWLEQLRQAPDQATLEDREQVFQAIQLFGAIRYTPAVNFLAAEAVHRKVGCIRPNESSDVWGVPTFEHSHPHLASLIQIGPSAVAPLVDQYVRYWKIGREREKTGTVLPDLEFTLGHESLIGAALNHIHNRLVKSNFGGIDRDELDALQHLKQELLKEID